MLIHKISVSNFMSRGDAELELPEAGVTVLTGHNGAGKSRFIEAVAHAYWGHTLRGESPWVDGLAGSVSVLSGAGDATRKITAKGTKSLTWNGNKADTASRTQEHIDAALPDFGFWKRTHVFSSADANHFSGATDGERKRIMEMLLGLDVFDRGQKQCTAELGQANAEVADIKLRVAESRGRLNVVRAKLSSIGTTYRVFEPGVPPREPPPRVTFTTAEFEQWEDVAREARELEQRDVHEPPAPSAADLRKAFVALEQTAQRLRLAESGSCPTCEQVWHGAPVSTLQAERDELRRIHAELEEQVKNERAEWRRLDGLKRVRLDELRETLHRYTKRSNEINASNAAWERYSSELQTFEQRESARRQAYAQEAAHHAAALSELRAEEQAELGELSDLQAALDEAQALADELTATATILGVRGLRGHVLGRALEGVELVANYWLQQIAPGRALSVRAEGDAGKISINLHGFGGGKYGAASSGERRRVDAPLLLALAEVAGSGRSRGTLFLDEVFDALDADGRELVCRALGELGATQSVVVITHQEDLAMRIPAVQRLRVEQGQIQRI